MQFINISAGSNWPPQAGPVFAGGTVHCGTLNIAGNARAELRGSEFFVTNNFDLHGMEFIVAGHGALIENAACELWSGHLYLPSMTLGEFASFDQMGGSNEISGGLTMVAGQYSLYGGRLATTGTGVGAGARFEQGGGQHVVHGVLSITGAYALNGASPQGGCSLDCEGLYLRGTLSLTLYFNGRDFDPAANFTNRGLLNLGGVISTELPDAHLGQVQLATNATIAFSNNFPATLHFDTSSSVPWSSEAVLSITNWTSSDHITVGNDGSGLNASQMRQLQFVNPSGFAPGLYAAQILGNGEIVPAQPAELTATLIPNGLVLTWPATYHLLSATNVTGPYLPVSGASTPWTNSFSQTKEFFMIAP